LKFQATGEKTKKSQGNILNTWKVLGRLGDKLSSCNILAGSSIS